MRGLDASRQAWKAAAARRIPFGGIPGTRRMERIIARAKEIGPPPLPGRSGDERNTIGRLDESGAARKI